MLRQPPKGLAGQDRDALLDSWHLLEAVWQGAWFLLSLALYIEAGRASMARLERAQGLAKVIADRDVEDVAARIEQRLQIVSPSS